MTCSWANRFASPPANGGERRRSGAPCGRALPGPRCAALGGAGCRTRVGDQHGRGRRDLGLGAGVGLAARAVWNDVKGGWIGAGAWAATLGLLAYVALSTPGPAPVPPPLSIGTAVIGVVMGILVLARAVGRRARWRTP